jgi:hypothetical protein
MSIGISESLGMSTHVTYAEGKQLRHSIELSDRCALYDE